MDTATIPGPAFNFPEDFFSKVHHFNLIGIPEFHNISLQQIPKGMMKSKLFPPSELIPALPHDPDCR